MYIFVSKCDSVTSCTCMDNKPFEHYQNETEENSLEQTSCYVRLPSNCTDLRQSKVYPGLLMSVEALSRMSNELATSLGDQTKGTLFVDHSYSPICLK